MCVRLRRRRPPLLRKPEVRAETRAVISFLPMGNTEMSKRDTEALRRARVRQLFGARPSEEHTETGVLLYYAWLQKYFPELLPTDQGDPYQHLKVDLKGLYK